MPTVDPAALVALALAGALLLLALLRRRPPAPRAPAQDESLDTVQAWPPQVVRVMTLGERQAYEVLRRALPGHVILAQVPLSRFISVPTRNPYQMWLQRAGRLAVDLLVCDYSSRAVAAIEVRTPDESQRNAKRHQRLVDVLRAAGIAVYEWNEDDLPSITDARELLALKPAAKNEAIDASGRDVIPVAEASDMGALLAAGDNTDYGRLEPVPSGFYDEAQTTR
jgi:hypothetical protein